VRRPADRVILFGTLGLVALGVLMIYSSTSVVATHGDPYHFLRRHLLALAVGLVAMAAGYGLRPQHWGRLSPFLLALALLLLLLVFVQDVGQQSHGANRWLRLGPMRFQPAELVKLAMVLFCAWFLSRPYIQPRGLAAFLMPVGLMGGFQVLLLKQPDFGGAVTLGLITMALLFVAGVRMRYLLALLVLAAPALLALLKEPYRLRRLTGFLDPWADPQGAGFQLVQSFIALGRGGLFGVGIGGSRQKLSYLPEVHTDFIFSVVGEELGFFAALAVVLTFAVLFVRAVLLAHRHQQERFLYLLGHGLGFMLAFQALINFMVVTGLAPTKGLPLPFLSHGGSALLVNLLAVGLLLRLSTYQAEPRRQDRWAEALRRKRAKRAIYGGLP